MVTCRSYFKLLPARLADASLLFALSHDLIRFRYVFDHVYPRMTVSASLSSVISSRNVIAAAAAGADTTHGAVTSTIAHMAVTAVAIALGACLSTISCGLESKSSLILLYWME